MLQILEQPDGKLCVYTAKDNKMLLENAEDSDVILYLINKEIQEKVGNIIDRTKAMIASARHNKEPLHEFSITYAEAIKRIKEKDHEKESEEDMRITHAVKEARKRADELGCKLNPDDKIVDRIVSALNSASINYGAAYCPCSILKNKSTVCCCEEWKKAMKDNSEKYCHCKLYINPNFCK